MTAHATTARHLAGSRQTADDVRAREARAERWAAFLASHRGPIAPQLYADEATLIAEGHAFMRALRACTTCGEPVHAHGLGMAGTLHAFTREAPMARP